MSQRPDGSGAAKGSASSSGLPNGGDSADALVPKLQELGHDDGDESEDGDGGAEADATGAGGEGSSKKKKKKKRKPKSKATQYV